MKVGLKINLDSQHNNHDNFKLTITPNYPEFGFVVCSINKIMKDLPFFYARLINQYKFKYQTLLSIRFDKQDEDNQVVHETELFFNLNINHNLTQTDIDNIDLESPLEDQIQQQEMKVSGWRFDKTNSMTVYFFKIGELNGSKNFKILLRSNAILNIENNDKYCFIWSILASLHPCNNNHPNRFSNQKQCFNELNINGFDISYGFRCNDVDKFSELNILSINIFELIFLSRSKKVETQNKTYRS